MASAGKSGAAGVATAGTAGSTAGTGGSSAAGKSGAAGTSGAAGAAAGAAGNAGAAGAAGAGGSVACDDVDVACPKGSFCGYAPCDAAASFDCPRVCKKLVPSCATAGACATTEFCADITYNSVDMGVCEERALPDAPCQFGIAGSCVDGYFCGGMGGVHHCTKIPKAGEPCETAAGSCGPGMYCAASGCATSLAAGATCADSRECQTGLFCSEAKLCEAFHAVGGACRSNGYSCTNGVCFATSLECQKGLVCAPSGPKGACFSSNDCGVGAGISCCVGANNQGACSSVAFCPGPMGVCATK